MEGTLWTLAVVWAAIIAAAVYAKVSRFMKKEKLENARVADVELPPCPFCGQKVRVKATRTLHLERRPDYSL